MPRHLCFFFLLSALLLWHPSCAVAEDARPFTPLPRLRELDFSPFLTTLQTLSKDRIAAIQRRLQKATILDLQNAMAAGEISSSDLTLFFLHQIHQRDATLRSYLELNPLCLEEARQADQLRLEGQVKGPLHGIPINLKDNIGTAAPLHTTVGSALLLDHSPPQDAQLVKQLREAGAVILGKASLSELAGMLTTNPPGHNAVSGIGVNPYVPTLPVSGSSSGSSISTTALLTTVSVGTETSGSLISPASKNGVVALKPSHGLVSGDGIVPLVRFQDCAGPIARTVTDAALLLDVIDSASIDYSAYLKSNAMEGLAVGILRTSASESEPSATTTYWFDLIDQGLAKAKAVPHQIDTSFQNKPSLLPVLSLGLAVDTIDYFKTAGAPIQTVADLRAYHLAEPSSRIPRGQNIIDLATEILASIATALDAPESELGPIYQEAALEARREAISLLKKTFQSHQVELLVSLGNTHSTLYATAGYPAITVPLGLDPEGRPNGVTFIGQPGQDARLLSFAYAFEQATRYRRPPPPPVE